jgi:hypothetical protein
MVSGIAASFCIVLRMDAAGTLTAGGEPGMGEVEPRTGVLGVQYPAGPGKANRTAILNRQQMVWIVQVVATPHPQRIIMPALFPTPLFPIPLFPIPYLGFVSAVLLG